MGLTALIAGIPVSMVGGAQLGYGAIDDNAALKISGGITPGPGAAMVLTALPLLVAGGTDVRDGRGRQIALRELPPSSPSVGALWGRPKPAKCETGRSRDRPCSAFQTIGASPAQPLNSFIKSESAFHPLGPDRVCNQLEANSAASKPMIITAPRMFR